jgi:endoglucanase
MLTSTETLLPVDYDLNPGLSGKTPLEVMDFMLKAGSAMNPPLRFMLDHHSCAPDAFYREELWYTSACSEEQWLSNWVMLATRYKDEPSVIAMDIHNEPFGKATWGSGNAANDWKIAAKKCGDMIHAQSTKYLVSVVKPCS